MADIDKALPNVKTEIKVPGDEEIIEAQKETMIVTGKHSSLVD